MTLIFASVLWTYMKISCLKLCSSRKLFHASSWWHRTSQSSFISLQSRLRCFSKLIIQIVSTCSKIQRFLALSLSSHIRFTKMQSTREYYCAELKALTFQMSLNRTFASFFSMKSTFDDCKWESQLSSMMRQESSCLVLTRYLYLERALR